MKRLATVFVVLSIVGVASGRPAAGQSFSVDPSPEHQVLFDNVGTWDAELVLTIPGSDQQPPPMKGVEVVKPFGKLWVITDLEYDFMGAPTQGHGVMGYDPTTKEFTGTWHESASPYLATMTGQFDPQTKKLTMRMEGRGLNGEKQEYKIVMWKTDETHRTFELHMKSPGSNDFVPGLRINYTRRPEGDGKCP
jgi:hypothetical protein